MEKFYKHLDDDIHTEYVYQSGTHPCLSRREKGFFNDFALHRHIQASSCEESDELLRDVLKCKACNDTTFPDIIGALDHLEHSHSQLLTVADSPYVCLTCDIGFPNKELFWVISVLIATVKTHNLLL
jgi:hypothetical protein